MNWQNNNQDYFKELGRLLHLGVAEKQYEFTYTNVKTYKGTIVVSWGVKNFGFGTTSFILEEKRIVMDTETMGPTFIAELLNECGDKIFEKITIL